MKRKLRNIKIVPNLVITLKRDNRTYRISFIDSHEHVFGIFSEGDTGTYTATGKNVSEFLEGLMIPLNQVMSVLDFNRTDNRVLYERVIMTKAEVESKLGIGTGMLDIID